MITMFTPTIVFMVTALTLANQVPVLAGSSSSPTNAQVLQPPPAQEARRPAQVTPVDIVQSPALSEDWQETDYLESIPGVGASIREGLSTPVSELQEVDLTKFSNLA